jgi:hypothetical protein
MASRGVDDRDTAFGSPAAGGGRQPRPEEASRGLELHDATPGLEMVSAGEDVGDGGDVRRFPRVAAEEDVPQQPLAERFTRRQ